MKKQHLIKYVKFPYVMPSKHIIRAGDTVDIFFPFMSDKEFRARIIKIDSAHVQIQPLCELKNFSSNIIMGTSRRNVRMTYVSLNNK